MPKYQAPQIDASPTFDSNRANEAERRHWGQDSYDRKNQEPVNYYDFTRKKLNFEIMRGEPLKDKDGNFRKDNKGHILYAKPSIIPLGSQPISLKKRFDNRLKEIGHKPWQHANGNQPNTNVSFVLNGDHDRMTEIAFGKPTDFVLNEDNSNVQLVTVGKDELEAIAKKYGVEELVDADQTYSRISIYALCFYKFLCAKFGEENVIGLQCHLDETTPHFHSLVVPVAEKQRSGRAGGYTLVDADMNPVLDKNGKEIHITSRAYGRMPEDQRANYVETKSTTIGLSYATYFGESPGQTSRSYEKWHDLIHKEVTKQWGFDRGERLRDMTPEERKDHRRKSKKQLERERLAAERNTIEEVVKEEAAKERTLIAEEKAAEAEKKAKQQETVISDNKTDIERLQNEKETLEDAIAEKRQEQERMNNESWLDTLKGLVNKSDKDKKYLAQIERLEKEALAVDGNGNPVLYKSGSQATWPRYAELLRSRIQDERAKRKPAIEAAVGEVTKKHQAEISLLRKQISSLERQLQEKERHLGVIKRLIGFLESIPVIGAAIRALRYIFSLPHTISSGMSRDQVKHMNDALGTVEGVEQRKKFGRALVDLVCTEFSPADIVREKVESEVDRVAQGTHPLLPRGQSNQIQR